MLDCLLGGATESCFKYTQIQVIQRDEISSILNSKAVDGRLRKCNQDLACVSEVERK